jgi:hypothetical protein
VGLGYVCPGKIVGIWAKMFPSADGEDGGEKVSEASLGKILDVCQLEDFVATAPDGLATPVAEWGSAL